MICMIDDIFTCSGETIMIESNGREAAVAAAAVVAVKKEQRLPCP